MEIALLFIIFIVLLAIGAPVGTSLGIAAIITILHYHLGIQMIGLNFISGIGSFPLLAIPFFVLAGMFFQQSGLARTIANFLKLLVGNLTGGMAMVAVITATFWGALSGSGPATTAAVGLILVAGMVEQGYDKNFAAATIATSSDLSIVIPPSIAFIIYGNITGTSVSALFAAGVLPGILTSIFLVITAYLISKRRGYRGASERRATIKEILIAFINSFWALLAPVIILGGIYGGIFTPTEAAVVAVFYSLFITVFVYKTLTLHILIKILRDAAVTSSVIMFIVVFAGMFSWTASVVGAIDKVTHYIVSIAHTPFAMIMLVNLLLLGLGMIIDAISISYLVLPIIMPMLKIYNIDPIWYGVIFVLALAISQATPPVGVNLFTAAGIIKSDIESIAKEAIPFVVAGIIALIVISLIPGLSLYLPIHGGLYSP